MEPFVGRGAGIRATRGHAVLRLVQQPREITVLAGLQGRFDGINHPAGDELAHESAHPSIDGVICR